MTVGTNCFYEISSTHLHTRKWIIQKLSCTARDPCRFKLLTKCSRGITLLSHSLCYYLCKFSLYLCNRPLHSALSYIKLSCPDIIFRLSAVFFPFPAHTSQRTQPVSVVIFSLSAVSCASAHMSYRTLFSIIKITDINVQTFTHEVPIIYVPMTSNLKVV
jgi:hypothetical protein